MRTQTIVALVYAAPWRSSLAVTYELFDEDEPWLVETYVAAAIRYIRSSSGSQFPGGWMLLHPFVALVAAHISEPDPEFVQG